MVETLTQKHEDKSGLGVITSTDLTSPQVLIGTAGAVAAGYGSHYALNNGLSAYHRSGEWKPNIGGANQYRKDKRAEWKADRETTKTAKDAAKADADKARKNVDKYQKKKDTKQKGLKNIEKQLKANPSNQTLIDAKANAQKAVEVAEKKLSKNAAKVPAKAGLTAGAKKMAAVGAKMAGKKLLAAGAAALIPGPGWVLGAAMLAWTAVDLAAMWFTKDNPAYDAEPYNTAYGKDSDRTEFLPLKGDGDVDDPICNTYDDSLKEVNKNLMNWDLTEPPNGTRLWHPNTPEVDKMKDISEEVNKIFNSTGDGVYTSINNIAKLYSDYGMSNTILQTLSTGDQGRTSTLEVIGREFQSSIEALAPAIVTGYPEEVNKLILRLREANAKNREEIANHGGAINPFFNLTFWTRDLNEGKMTEAEDVLTSAKEGTEEMKRKLSDIDKAPDIMKTALSASNAFAIPKAPREITKSADDKKPEDKKPNVPFTPGNVTPSNVTPKDTTPAKNDPGKNLDDLLNKLSNKTPSTTPQMPTLPQMSTPQMPNLGNTSKPETAPVEPKDRAATEDDLAKLLADKKDEKPEAKEDVPPLHTLGVTPDNRNPENQRKNLTPPPDGAVLPGGPEDTGDNKPSAPVSPDDNTRKIGNKDVTFHNPKEAKMAEILNGASPENPKSLAAAAAEAGLTVPPQGQDIGTLKAPSEIEPGHVIINKDGEGFVYLGGEDVLSESGEIKKLSDVAMFDGQNQGIFSMADSGSPMPETPGEGLTDQLPGGAGEAPAVTPADNGNANGQNSPLGPDLSLGALQPPSEKGAAPVGLNPNSTLPGF